jgi:ATP-dependent Clp protease ATP-binding subunit ClpA
MQLEAQLADRNITIELSDEAREWLVAHGYDDAMGARPMGRLIQSAIKTPLADEVLFGKLKGGGAVRVVVEKDEDGREKLGFEYLEGVVKPKPEKLPEDAAPRKPKRKPRPGARKPKKPDGEGPSGNGGGNGGVRTVPKVPLVRA